MNLGIIGNGGREHSLCFKLLKSSKVNKIFCIPGNAGTSHIAKNVDINIDDFKSIKNFGFSKIIIIICMCPRVQLQRMDQVRVLPW